MINGVNNIKTADRGLIVIISFVAVLEAALWIFLILHII